MRTSNWYTLDELTPEYDGTVQIELKNGERKSAFYAADEDGDYWYDSDKEIPADSIKKWAYFLREN